MFPVKKYGQVLDKMAADKDVKVHHTSNLIKIDKVNDLCVCVCVC